MPFILEKSLTRTLISRVETTPKAIAFTQRLDSKWITYTYQEFLEEVFALASSLGQKGVKPGDRIPIVGNTSYEFIRTQWALITIGAIPVPLSPLQSENDLHTIFKDCEARAFYLESANLLNKLNQAEIGFSESKLTILFEQNPELIEQGRGLLASSGAEKLRQQLWDTDPHALFLLIYTSGTTGEPKGSMIAQSNFMCSLHDCTELFRAYLATEQEKTLMILPLANIFGQFELAIGFVVGWTTCFPTRLDRLETEITEVQPTLFFGVPKLFERILSGIQDDLESRPTAERILIERLIEATRRVAHLRQIQERPSLTDTAESLIAKQTVLKGIQKRLGGKLKFAISGGAPLPPALASELHLLGIPVLEGYGLTETSGPIAINDPSDPGFGSVGKPLNGCEFRILSDGEITVKTKEPFMGYWKDPAATGEILREGWLHTGDLGYLDEKGRLHITDRKKDVIILSNGRNIAPQKIEARVSLTRYLEDLVVLGDRQDYLGALITLKQSEIIKFCTERQILFSRFTELVNHPKIQSLVQSEVQLINEGLSPYERIRKFVILPESLSVRSGELTHTQKLRRKQISEHHPEALELLFGPRSDSQDLLTEGNP